LLYGAAAPASGTLVLSHRDREHLAAKRLQVRYYSRQAPDGYSAPIALH
jgi:hypothetical protein